MVGDVTGRAVRDNGCTSPEMAATVVRSLFCGFRHRTE